MTAVNGVGESNKSSEVSTTPAAPGSDTPTYSGAGLLASSDMGNNVAGTRGAQSVGGWSATTGTYTSTVTTVSNHNTIAAPDGSLAASTVEFNATAASGYGSIECATSAVPGTGAITYSFYAKGHVGGEQINLKIYDSSRTAGTSSTTTLTLTNFVGDVVFNVCWPNAA